MMNERTVDSRLKRRELIFLTLAGPVIWSLQFLVGYGLSEALCTLGVNFTLLGFDGINALIVLETLVALGITLYAGLRARQLWQSRPQRESSQDAPDVDGVSELLGRAAIWLNGLFALAIVLSGLAAVLLRPC